MQRHFTATAFIINSRRETLLLWHKRLQRWMPPGGHVDPDETPADTARRECKEETGLDVEIIGDEQPDLFDDNASEGRMIPRPWAMLLENIPASESRNEPAHQHMDFLYIARPLNESQALQLAEQEASDMRWFSLDAVSQLNAETDIYANVKNYITLLLSHEKYSLQNG